MSGEDFERYYFSKGWVFPGWIGFSQWIKKEFGYYPKGEMLVELVKMSKAEREEHTRFGLYLWEKKHLVGNKVFCKCKVEIDGDEEKDYYSVL